MPHKTEEARMMWLKKDRAFSPEKYKLKRKQYYWRDVEKSRKEAREKHREYRYGVPYAVFLEKIKEQNGKCGICKNGIQENATLDHCHKTGKMRGLLCRACNRGLGMFGDSLPVLKEAIEYVRRYEDA